MFHWTSYPRRFTVVRATTAADIDDRHQLTSTSSSSSTLTPTPTPTTSAAFSPSTSPPHQLSLCSSSSFAASSSALPGATTTTTATNNNNINNININSLLSVPSSSSSISFPSRNTSVSTTTTTPSTKPISSSSSFPFSSPPSTSTTNTSSSFRPRDRRRVHATTPPRVWSFPSSSSSSDPDHVMPFDTPHGGRRRPSFFSSSSPTFSPSKVTSLVPSSVTSLCWWWPSARMATSLLVAALFICVLTFVSVSRLNGPLSKSLVWQSDTVVTGGVGGGVITSGVSTASDDRHDDGGNDMSLQRNQRQVEVQQQQQQTGSVHNDSGGPGGPVAVSVGTNAAAGAKESASDPKRIVVTGAEEGRVTVSAQYNGNTLTSDDAGGPQSVDHSMIDSSMHMATTTSTTVDKSHSSSMMVSATTGNTTASASLAGENRTLNNMTFSFSSSSFSAVDSSPFSSPQAASLSLPSTTSDTRTQQVVNTMTTTDTDSDAVDASDLHTFSNRTTLVYFHLHKTGGVSFKQRLYTYFYAPGRVKSDGSTRVSVFDTCHVAASPQADLGREARWACDWSEMAAMSPGERQATDVIIGHQYWEIGARHYMADTNRKLRYFTVLRHPLHRKISFFFHFFVRNAGRSEKDVSYAELRDFVLDRDVNVSATSRTNINSSGFGSAATTTGRLDGDGQNGNFMHARVYNMLRASALMRDAGPAYYASRLQSDGVIGFDKRHRYNNKTMITSLHNTDHNKKKNKAAIADAVNRRLRTEFVFIGLQAQERASLCMLQRTVDALSVKLGVKNRAGVEDIGKAFSRNSSKGGTRLNAGDYPITAKDLWNSMSAEERGEYEEVEMVDLRIYEEGAKLFRKAADRLGCGHLVEQRQDEYMGMAGITTHRSG